MGFPIRTLSASALRLLICWLLALQPMIGAYAAAQAANAPLTAELCRGAPAPMSDQGVPAESGHSPECCLACAPTPALPPAGFTGIAVPAPFAQTTVQPRESVTVPTAGLGLQSARAPPL